MKKVEKEQKEKEEKEERKVEDSLWLLCRGDKAHHAATQPLSVTATDSGGLAAPNHI